jgi:hypothetical protein
MYVVTRTSIFHQLVCRLQTMPTCRAITGTWVIGLPKLRSDYRFIWDLSP